MQSEAAALEITGQLVSGLLVANGDGRFACPGGRDEGKTAEVFGTAPRTFRKQLLVMITWQILAHVAAKACEVTGLTDLRRVFANTTGVA